MASPRRLLRLAIARTATAAHVRAAAKPGAPAPRFHAHGARGMELAPWLLEDAEDAVAGAAPPAPGAQRPRGAPELRGVAARKGSAAGPAAGA